MTKLALDSNSVPIQVVQPYSAIDITDGSHEVALNSHVNNHVARLCSAAGGSYGINAAASVLLPGGAIEYIRVAGGDVINVTGTFNLALCK
jgi:hypothetical protein